MRFGRMKGSVGSRHFIYLFLFHSFFAMQRIHKYNEWPVNILNVEPTYLGDWADVAACGRSTGIMVLRCSERDAGMWVSTEIP